MKRVLMSEKTITIIDVVECRASPDLIPFITPCLAYKSSVWIPGPFRRIEKVVDAFFIHQKTGIFLAGLLDHVRDYLRQQKIQFSIKGEFEKINPSGQVIARVGDNILRDYQLEAIEELKLKQRGVLLSSTGSGKSAIAVGFIKSYEPGTKFIFLCHSISILKQLEKTMKEADIDVSVCAGKEDDLTGDVVLASIQTASRWNPEWHCTMFDGLLIDECFSPKTECLTENGWEKIKDLNPKTKVAQYDQDSEEISFTKPTKHIKKTFKGKLYHLEGKHTDILCTPNHQQPFFRLTTTKLVHKKEIQNWSCSSSDFLPVSGYAPKGSKLTPLERFLVAFAADGSVNRTKENQTVVDFQFSKKRKINKLLKILKEGNISFSEIKSNKSPNPNVKKRRRFLVRLEGEWEKGLKQIKKLEEISLDWGQDFINEIMLWDGSTKTVDYWCGTNNDDADYIQAVCAISGITCNRNFQIDKRKKSYKPVHHFTFIKSNRRSCQRMKITTKPYEGEVVCVRVPAGNIIIRSENKVSISGNCHHVISKTSGYGKFLRNNLAPIRVGFTATIPKEKKSKLALTGLIGPEIKALDITKGIEEGFLSRPEIRLIAIPSNPIITKQSKYKEIYNKGVTNSLTRNRAIIQILSDHARKNESVLIVVKEIEHGENLLKLVPLNLKNKVEFVQGITEDREKIRQKLLEKSIMGVIATSVWGEGIDLPNLDVLVFAQSGKSEIQTIQRIGRALRTSVGKEKAIIYDFLDREKYLAEHCVERLCTYLKLGWI